MGLVEQNKIKRSGIGVRALDRTRAFPGFTLFAPLTANGTVYLIDLVGTVVHTWQMPYMDRIFKRPFLWPELLRSPGRGVNSFFSR